MPALLACRLPDYKAAAHGEHHPHVVQAPDAGALGEAGAAGEADPRLEIYLEE